MAKLIGKVQRIPRRGVQGPSGIPGVPGKDGQDGKDAPSLEEIRRLIPKPIQGLQGLSGLQGPQGPIGPKGEDGKDIDLGEVKDFVEKLLERSKPTQQKGIGGGGSPVKYITTITSSEYRINSNELQAGTNIFGVNFAGDVTVYLPAPHERLKEKIIVINDESGLAGTNNITVTVA